MKKDIKKFEVGKSYYDGKQAADVIAIEDGGEEIFDTDSAIEDELFHEVKIINNDVRSIIETREICKKLGIFQKGHCYIFGGVVTINDKKSYYTYKWDSVDATSYDTELTPIKRVDALEIAREWSNQNGEISFEEFMAASNAEYKEIRKIYLELNGEGGIARQYDQDLWDEMQSENAASDETVDVENYVEDDGSNDDADEEDEVLTANYNVDVEDDDDDELIDEKTFFLVHISVTPNPISKKFKRYHKMFSTKAAAFKFFETKQKAYSRNTQVHLTITEGYNDYDLFKYDYDPDKGAGFKVDDEVMKIFFADWEIKQKAKKFLGECKEFVESAKEREGNAEWYAKRIRRDMISRAKDKAKKVVRDARRVVADSEVITVEEKVIATADLEKELTRIKGHVEVMKEIIFDNNVAIKDNQKKILEYIAAIMTNENAITAYGVENISLGNKIDELEEEAAALEAEILNRKITESYIDSIVTAAAFNASIQAEEMAAANNAEPVTFELERFNDGETAIEETAEIDTSISVAEVPIVDEDAEDEYNSTLKKFNDEIANIETQIKKLQEEIIMPLQKKLEESVKQRNLHIRAMEKWVQKKIPEVTLTEYIKLTSQHGTTTATLRKEDDCTNRLFVDGDSNGGFKISDYKKTLASYSTLKAFKAAVNGLAAAIEHGDKKFTFPADDSEKERKKNGINAAEI